jgi:alanine racemase
MVVVRMKNTWIELDLDVLRANIMNLRAALSHSTTIICVVKAEAYGHGMIPVARCAWDCGVRWFAVVHLNEALALRALLPDANILILGVIGPEHVEEVLRANLTPVLISESQAVALAAAATARGGELTCHVKVDTGMGRLGFLWDEAAAVLPRLAALPGLRMRGICTHFASADSADGGFADVQADRFRQVVKACEAARITGLFRHAANSGAIMSGAPRDLDGVRPGILLYGYGSKPAVSPQSAPGATPRPRVETRPFLQWKTRVVQIRKVPAGFPVSYDSTYVTRDETRIATLDVGYADGYARQLGNRGEVLIRGKRQPVVGRVTMNLIAVDLGPTGEAAEGDEVVLIGRQGQAAVWADEVAAWRDTIAYEVLTNIRTTDISVKGTS